MKIYVDTSSFIALLDEEIRRNLIIKYPEIKEGKIEFYISPYVIEEFFHTIIYKEDKNLNKFVGPKKNIEEKIEYFFDNFEEVLIRHISGFKILEVKGEIPAVFFDKELLRCLTKKTRTYDLLHLFTSILSNLDGILISDKSFFEWIKENREKIKNYLNKTSEYFLVILLTKKIVDELKIKR